MDDMLAVLRNWQLDAKAVRERMYRAPTPRERERWHAMWLLAQGWTSAQVAEALERDAHTIGDWAEALRRKGPEALAFEQTGGAPPPLMRSNKRS
jgi:transposase